VITGRNSWVRHEKGRGQKLPFAIDLKIFTNTCHFQRRLYAVGVSIVFVKDWLYHKSLTNG
jgi:hypothetical protein